MNTKLTTFAEFKGNYTQLKSIQSFLDKSNNKKLLCLIGEHSSGKSSIYDILDNINNHEILLLNTKPYESIETIIHNFTKYKSVYNMFTNQSKEKLIFIDNIDVIFTYDKQIFHHIMKLNCKCIITISTYEEKKLSSIKKHIDSIIYLKVLSYKDCFQVILSTLERNDIDIDDIDTEKCLDLIKRMNCNISKVFMMIDDIKIQNDKIVLLDDTNDHTDTNNTFLQINKIFSNQLDEKHLWKLADKESLMLISLIHENIPQYQIKLSNLSNLINIYEGICYGDIIDKFTYVNCDWFSNLAYSSMFYRMTIINRTFNTMEKPNVAYKFTQQFTKLSSQMSIKKKLLQYNDSLIKTYLLQILQYYINNKISFKEKIVNDILLKFKKEFT
jgi:energy-coupling factor transporter ATP-binding protein EcfA2